MLARAAILFALMVAGTVAIARAERFEPVPVRNSFDQFPMRIGEWQGFREPPFEPRILAVLGVDDYLTRAYFAPDRSGAGLYIGYYKSQRQGDTMHSPLNCLPGSGWEPLSKRTIIVPLDGARGSGAPAAIEVNRYVVQKGIERQLVLYWYQSHGRVVASEYWSKFYLIADAVRLNRTDGALVRVIVPIKDGAESEAQAEHTAKAFVRQLFPSLVMFLPG